MIVVITVAYASMQASMADPIREVGGALICFTHSRQANVLSAAQRAVNRCEGILLDYQSNRGLARSWNEGIKLGQENDATTIILANDDVTFSAKDLMAVEKAVEKAEPNNHVVYCTGTHSEHGNVPAHGYSFFALLPQAIETMGYFDENLFPAYFEDNDYDRRALLAGFTHALVETNAHHIGSASIKANPFLARQNHNTFSANREYYFEKWGGGPHEEEFERPFNDPNFGLKIHFDAVHAPYPGHNRKNPNNFV